MIKKIFGLLLLSVVIASCGNSGTKVENGEATVVEFASLIENPVQFENTDITITGKVVHVCTHSGKKMFIVGENPDIRLFITAGEDIPQFPMELLGSEITVTGLLTVVEAGEKMGEGEHKDEMGEGEHKEGMDEAVEGEHKEGMAEEVEGEEVEVAAEDCETEEAVAKQVALKDHVLQYKSHVVK
jgi:hypothetical protein